VKRNGIIQVVGRADLPEAKFAKKVILPSIEADYMLVSETIM
jgi:hypothetical protein